MEIDIGSIIRKVAEQGHVGPTELGKRIGTSKQNIYGIYKRKSMDSGLMLKLSLALDHDFFQYYVRNFENLLADVPKANLFENLDAEPAGRVEELNNHIQVLSDYNADLKQQLADLKQQVSDLKHQLASGRHGNSPAA